MTSRTPERTSVRRHPGRGVYDREAIAALLDDARVPTDVSVPPYITCYSRSRTERERNG